MKRIVAKKPAQDLEVEKREVLLHNQRGYRARKATWIKHSQTGMSPKDSRGKQIQAVAVHVEDVYNRVWFKQL